MKNGIITAAYYFPNYHVDPRNEAIHGKGWTEWELMKLTRPRFKGHVQPKIPLWGWEDEAVPSVMARKIDTAADHGIDAFIFDWYWYEGPYLERCLNEGFLKAPNAGRLQFALMWANHDWDNFHPALRVQPYPRDFTWTTTKATVGYVWDYILEKYLTHPNYLRIDGKPYFSIYAMNHFVEHMGRAEDTAEVFSLLREKARKAGLPGVHINGIWFDILDNSPYCAACPQTEWVAKLGVDSYTTYNNLCISKKAFSVFPRVDYRKAADEYLNSCRNAMKTLPAPYYPVVTVSWDSSPRTVQSEIYDPAPGYPYLPVMEASPDDFAYALEKTRQCLKNVPARDRILFINAWNEWTEGSYLEPDTRYRCAFLEVLKQLSMRLSGKKKSREHGNTGIR